MRIVITGGAGFLGVRLARALLARGTLTDARGTRAARRANRAARRRRAAGARRSRASRDHRRPRRSGGRSSARVTADTDSVIPSRRRRQRAGRGRLRHRHARESRRDARAARALPEARRAAEVRVHELARGLRRPAARPGARRRAAHAAGVVRRAEGDRRIPRLRHDAQGLHRRALAAPADGHRASGQAEQGRVVVRERHRPRAAGRRRRDLSGGADHEDVGALAARRSIDNLIVGHEAPASAFAHTRSINVPGILVAVGDMVAALRRVAGDAVADRVKWQFDPAIDRIVSTWPANFAPKLGTRARHAGRRGFRGHRPRVHRRRHAAGLESLRVWSPCPFRGPCGVG